MNRSPEIKAFKALGKPSEAIEKLTLLAVALISGKEVSEANRKVIGDCLMEFIQLKTAQVEHGKKAGKKRGASPHPSTIWRDKQKEKPA